MGFTFRDFLSLSPGDGGIAPPWLATPPTRPVNVDPADFDGARFMFALGLGLDALASKIDQAMAAHMPGYGTATALGLLSLDRLIPRGPTELDAAFIPRLQAWLDFWRLAGNARAALQQLRGFVSPDLPKCRTVDGSSNWSSYTPDADPIDDAPAVVHASNWDWDGVGSAAIWRYWVIVYRPASAPAIRKWGDGGKWGDGRVWNGWPFSANARRDLVAALRFARAAHADLWGVICCNDNAGIVPTDTSAVLGDGSTTLPVGNWYRASDPVTGNPTRAPYAEVIYNLGHA